MKRPLKRPKADPGLVWVDEDIQAHAPTKSPGILVVELDSEGCVGTAKIFVGKKAKAQAKARFFELVKELKGDIRKADFEDLTYEDLVMCGDGTIIFTDDIQIIP